MKVPRKPYNLYEANEIQAIASDSRTAWMLIRNESHRLNQSVPNQDLVKLVRPLTIEENKKVRERQHKEMVENNR